MGPDDYKRALRAVESPDAPPEVKAAAKDVIARYSSALAGRELKNHSEQSLEDKPTDFGPTGLDAMAAAGLVPQEDAAERERQIQASEAKHPGIARALSLRAPTAGPVIPGTSENDLRRAAGADLNSSLRNASKRPELDAPPEWHPPTPAQPAANFDSVWGKLSAVKQALPSWMGGGTEHYVEPTVEQFRQEMATVLGPAVATLDRNSDAYRSYADMKYGQALQAAQAEGRGIVREAYSKEITPNLGIFTLAEAKNATRAGAVGVDKALTGGTAGTVSRMPGGVEFLARTLTGGPTALATMAGEAIGNHLTGGGTSPEEIANDYRAAARENELEGAGSPIARDVGFALGSLSPAAPGNAAAGMIPGKLPTAIRGLAGGAVGGAVTSGVATAPSVALGDMSPKEAAADAGKAALYGAPFGLIGGLLGSAARKEGETLRKTTPLGEAEKGGASISPIRGVRPGPVNEALEARAREGMIGPSDRPDVEGMLAHDLAKPFGERANEMQGEITQKGQPLREFERTFAHDQIPMKNTVRAILDAKKKLVQSDGTVASVNQPEMAKLDKLLDDVMSIKAQPPESALSPKNEQRLNQMENAAALHGDLGTNQPEVVARDVRELSTPTRPITPVNSEVAPRRARDTAIDLGDFSEKLPDFRTSLEGGMAGERLRSLHEDRLSTPETFDITPRDAMERGLGVGKSTVKVFDPETRQMVDADVPNFARLSPRLKSPADVRALSHGVRDRHESGSATKEPFPDYDKIKRAFHEDRDAFLGETDKIKQSDTFDLPGGKTVRGYSAANARLEQETRQFEDFLDLIGFKGGKPPRVDEQADFIGMENAARNYGRGGRSPAIDEALRRMAAETGMEPTLQNLQRYRAMKDLEQMSRLREIFRFGGAPSVGSLSGPAARLRLDPIIQGSIGPLERAGSLGALPGEIERERRLPPTADDATIEEIQRALQP